MWKFILPESEWHFNKLLRFLVHEKILPRSYLSYVILKFTISGFPLKIVNLFWIDVGCR